MSGSAGSPYGRGYYGRGPYGQAVRVMGIVGAPTVKIRAAPPIALAQLSILSAPGMWFGLTQMWAPIDVPPCEVWETIGQPGCWQAVPNNAGKMFG
jgi:hypothetical protein